MAEFYNIQSSFLGGELSPKALGRLDLDIYKAGCSTLLNFLVEPHGGIKRRGGTKFVAEVKTSSKTTILHAFSYENEHFYVLEFGDNYIRFYKDQAQIQGTYAAWATSTEYVLGDLVTESGNYYRCIEAHTSDVFATDLAADKWIATSGSSDLAYEIPTTYDENELEALRFTDDGEVLYIAHKDHAPTKLVRSADDSWVLSDVSYISFGRVPEVAGAGYGIGETLTITQAGASEGTVEVTAIDADGGVTSVKTITQGTGYKIATGLATVTDGTGDDACTINCTSDTAPPEWGANNYPTLVWFFEQRLYFAATPDEPNQIWGSQAGDFFNFELGTSLDAEGISVKIKQATSLLWAAPMELMHLGASNGEFLLIASGTDEAITPTNIRPLKATGYGSSNVQAIGIDASPVFIQRGKRKIRRLEFQIRTSSYTASDIALLSEHITESGIESIAYINEPNSYIFMRRVDGSLAIQTYDPVNQIYACHKHTLGGADVVVNSIAATDGKTAGRDELWMIVSRTVDESTVQYIEFLTHGLLAEDDQEDSFFVDSGVTATGSSLSSVDTLAHLEGETVSILADGAVQANQEVSGGSVTISPVADTVHVGLSYTSRFDTLPIEGGNPLGTSQGLVKRIHNVILRLYRSLGFTIGVPDETLDTYYFGPTTSMDDAIPLFTGDTEEIPFSGGPDNRSLIRIEQTEPLPLNILAVITHARTEI